MRFVHPFRAFAAGSLLATLMLGGCATTNEPRAEAGADVDAQTSADAPAPAASEADGFDEAAILAAAESTFGQGAEGLAKLVEDIFREQGRPNAYIVGREGSGAIGVGLRYGSGTLYHKIEGERPVYWSGPSLGLDVGGDANRTFTLVYNLHDTEELFRRYPAAEGKVYVVGGFTANYVQRGDIILVPIKLGVGWRLGANIGYVNFTKEERIVPF